MPAPRLTLRPDERLKRRADFLRVQSAGRKHHTRHFLIIVSRREGGAPSRVGITITKKVANAVGRNRVKRLVREVFRRERARFPMSSDVVFIAKDGSPELCYDEVLAELPSRWNLGDARAPRTRQP